MALSERAKHATTDPNAQDTRRKILAFLADGHSHTRRTIQAGTIGDKYGALFVIQHLHDMVGLGWVNRGRWRNVGIYWLSEAGKVQLDGAEAFMGEAS